MAEQPATWRLELRRAGRASTPSPVWSCPTAWSPSAPSTPGASGSSRGAFAGATTNAKQIRLTDSHLPGQARRPVGVATEFREAAEGVLDSFRFYDTPEGRGADENVADGTYGGLSSASPRAGSGSAADGVREVLEARLFHVTLVDEPAYQEGRVLAVRATEDALTSEIAGLLQRDWSTVWR